MRRTILILAFVLALSFSALAQEVILVSDNEADLGVAEVASSTSGAAVITTEWGVLSNSAVSRIRGLKPKKVVIIGGPVAVPPAAETTINAAGITTVRISGADRYETAAEVMEYFWKEPKEVILVQGTDDLTILDKKREAIARGVPIMFVKPGYVPLSVKAKLTKLKIKNAKLYAAPNTNTDAVRSDLTSSEVSDVSVEVPDSSARAEIQLDSTDTLVRETLEDIDITLASDPASIAASKLITRAEAHLKKAKEAYKEGNFGQAYGQAIAAKELANAAAQIRKEVHVGWLGGYIQAVDREIKQVGMAKVKTALTKEASKSIFLPPGEQTAFHEAVETVSDTISGGTSGGAGGGGGGGGGPGPPIRCHTNAGCAADGYHGDYYCESGDVYRKYRTHTCHNPGTASSACTFQVTSPLIEDCSEDNPCVEGQATCPGTEETTQNETTQNETEDTIACSSEVDCGTDGWTSDNYCYVGFIYRNYMNYTCNNQGTVLATCSEASVAVLIQDCNATGEVCSEGDTACSPSTHVTCSSDSDCGAEGFVGGKICDPSNGNLYQWYDTYPCLSPGTTSSVCEYEKELKKVEDCGAQGCWGGECKGGSIACSSNSDCGTDGWTSDNYCYVGFIYRNYITYTCSNPGASSSACSDASTAEQIEDCSLTNQTCTEPETACHSP